MELVLNPFSITLLISGALVGLLSTFIAIRLGDSTRWIALTMLSASIWGLFYGLELSSNTQEAMLLFIKFEYLGILSTPAFWLIFCMKYTGMRSKFLKLIYFLIGAIPAVSYLILLTNDFHHLHYVQTAVNDQGPFPVLEITIGPWYLVNIFYTYATFVIGLIILWTRFHNADPFYKTQTKFIFVAGIVPIFINLFYQLDIIRVYSEIDLTPYAFLFTYLILAFAIIRFNLFSIKPIAKERIIETITRGVLVIDSSLNIVDINPALKAFFKNPESVKTGENLKVILKDYQVILDLIQSNEPKFIEVQDATFDERKVIRIECIPILERKSSLSGSVLLFEDISEEVLTKEKLQTQAKELQQLNNLKDKYFSIISHDLKGPIFGVKELIHLTQSGIISQEEFMTMMPEISKNMENVAILLENLLAWTSSQIRGEFLQLSDFNIQPVLVQQKNLLERIAKEKEIEIKVEGEREAWVLADKNMIELVIRNLLNNAVKFSGLHGIIKMSTKTEDQHVSICIEDNGSGISEENLTKLRNRISFTTKGQHNESGTGLGLILVNEYIAKNHGSLEIRSELGKGTTFCIQLPLGTKTS
ncbi:PAS domain-containing sensor histidine kinase [Algoriphagus lutimaris]|uniref:sensor histidine kinase n=1 Tax=Algoriphagus lutimaris TaxID=613197 RepID=UPI00196AD8ED|nr:histidine kinase N-terminal 7TM domain-containing protein [Algoriphagus lutimaris]MBN3519811.1 PAS domain-containing sensor histidine kinase [Algoriphagus lutimaris]